MRISRIISAMAVATALAASAVPAHAADVDQGTWDSGDAYAACGSGTNSRTCSYDFYSYGCTEASTVGVNVAPCWFYLNASVTVVPILNAAGKVIGCTSQALSASGHGEFDSSFNRFDNYYMDDTFIFEVKDIFGDGNPGVAKFTVIDGGGEQGTRTWLASGSFVTSCARNANQWNSGGAGSVTVQV